MLQFFADLLKSVVDWFINLVIQFWNFILYCFDVRNGLFYDIFSALINQFKSYIDMPLYLEYYSYANYFFPLSETIAMALLFVTYAITFKLIKALLSLIKIARV